MPRTLEEYYLSGITKEYLHELRKKRVKTLEEKIILITIYLDILEDKQAKKLIHLVKLTLKKKKNISKDLKNLILVFLESKLLLITSEYSKILEKTNSFCLQNYASYDSKEKSFLILIMFVKAEALFRLGNYTESQKILDLILSTLQKAKENESLLSRKVIQGLFYRISFMNNFYKGEVKEAEEAVFKGIEIYENSGNLTYQAYFQNFLGIINTLRGNLFRGEEAFYKSIDLFESIEDVYIVKYTAGIYTNISSLLREQGRLNEAIEIVFRSLKIYTQLDQQVEIANCYNYLGMYYRDLREYELAESYLYKAYNIRKKFQDPVEISDSLVNICILEEKINKLDKNSICLREFPNKYGSKLVHANKLLIEALINYSTGVFDTALIIMEEVLNTEGLDFSIRLLIMDYKAEIFLETFNYNKFSEWIITWKVMAEKNNLVSSLFKAYLISFKFNLIFSNFDLAKEDIKNASKIAKKYSTLAQRLVEQNLLLLNKRMSMFKDIKPEKKKPMKEKNKEEELKELRLYIKDINSLLINYQDSS